MNAISSEAELKEIFTLHYPYSDKSHRYDFHVSRGITGDQVVLEVRSMRNRLFK
jgi:hypothetical protein